MLLAAGLHLSPQKDEFVRHVVKQVSMTNRDPHLIFNQVGQMAGLIPGPIVSSAFINLWADGNAAPLSAISEKIRSCLG